MIPKIVKTMIPLSTSDRLSARRKIVHSRAGHRRLRNALSLALVLTTAWLSIACSGSTAHTGNALAAAAVSDTVGLPAKRLAHPVPAWSAPFYNQAASDSTYYPVFFQRPQGLPGRIVAPAPASPYRINADTLRRRRVDAARNTPYRG